MGYRAYKAPALSRRRKVTHHAREKESLVGLAAAAACCMVGGAGGGLPLEAGHEDNGSAGCAEQRTGRAVCVGVGQRQPTLFAGVYGGLCGGCYRSRDRPKEHPSRRGAWLGGLGRCVPVKQVLHGQARNEPAADPTFSHRDTRTIGNRWLACAMSFSTLAAPRKKPTSTFRNCWARRLSPPPATIRAKAAAAVTASTTSSPGAIL